jgi:hypothetical protein
MNQDGNLRWGASIGALGSKASFLTAVVANAFLTPCDTGATAVPLLHTWSSNLFASYTPALVHLQAYT